MPPLSVTGRRRGPLVQAPFHHRRRLLRVRDLGSGLGNRGYLGIGVITVAGFLAAPPPFPPIDSGPRSHWRDTRTPYTAADAKEQCYTSDSFHLCLAMLNYPWIKPLHEQT